MILIFREDLIVTRWSRESFLAGGNGRFADKLLAFEEMSALKRDVDDDFRRARDTVAVPKTRRRSGRDQWGRRGLIRHFHFRAAREEREQGETNRASKEEKAGHKVADSNVFSLGFNTKRSGLSRLQNRYQI